ncbi:spermine oxidase-like [Haematobia irritans]|uniref:spermine oxidase-like n=1 Tax=Haematobia irritans TaxID=7368 RepID=UPI003F508D48
MCLKRIFQKYFGKKKKSSHRFLEPLIRDSFSIASCLVMNKSNSTPISNRIPYEPKIIIIGAGAAGLACATKLFEFGYNDLLILEAENRIGGRIHTQRFGDNVIDLGAQWVHGEVNNIVYEMVKNHGCLETSGEIYKTYECIRSNGEVVPDDTIDLLKDILIDIYENCAHETVNYEGSFGDYLSARFQQAMDLAAMQNLDHNVAQEFFENFKKIQSSETSSRMDQVSAKGFHEYWQCPGEYLLNWKDKGYVTFLHLLMGSNDEKIFGMLEEHILFNCHVDYIQWDRVDHKVIVSCNKGMQEYEADHVVLTIPLGVLKENVETMFHPQLPLQKKQAIVGLGYGSVGKIFLEFPASFWPPNWYGFTLLWMQEDLKELQQTSLEWVEEIYGFYCVNYQPRVLLAWLVGPWVAKVEQMPLDQVKLGCMYLLKRFLRKWQIPDPLNIQVSQWQSNPNFLGAYSFRSMLSEELKVSALKLSEPLSVLIPGDLRHSCSTVSHLSDVSSFNSDKVSDICPLNFKPILLFAGEATSMHHYSTVHGAVESGHREANRLIYYYSEN